MKYRFEDLSDADVNLIGEVLDDQPFRKVASLARRLQAQIDAQNAEAAAAAEAQQKAAVENLVNSEINKRGLVEPRRTRKG